MKLAEFIELRAQCPRHLSINKKADLMGISSKEYSDLMYRLVQERAKQYSLHHKSEISRKKKIKGAEERLESQRRIKILDRPILRSDSISAKQVQWSSGTHLVNMLNSIISGESVYFGIRHHINP